VKNGCPGITGSAAYARRSARPSLNVVHGTVPSSRAEIQIAGYVRSGCSWDALFCAVNSSGVPDQLAAAEVPGSSPVGRWTRLHTSNDAG